MTKEVTNKKRKPIIVITLLTSCMLLICSGVFWLYNQNLKYAELLRDKDQVVMRSIKKFPITSMDPQPNEEIGVLYFPKVEMRVPMVYGYNADFMDQYFDLVGLEAWGNFPGQNNKLYINGHRHLAFQNLKYMELDDRIILYMPYGEFTYQVIKEPQVVLATDKEAIAFYTKDHDTEFTPQILRLQTCYPFEAGAPLNHRYLVDLELVESTYY